MLRQQWQSGGHAPLLFVLDSASAMLPQSELRRLDKYYGAVLAHDAVPTPTYPDTKPMLKTLWAQQEPYNQLLPRVDGTRPPVGCVPVAMGQVMHYWQYPRQGTGYYIYRAPDSKHYKIAFSDYTIHWDSIRSQCNATDDVRLTKQTSLFLMMCGFAVAAQYGVDQTSSQAKNLKRALSSNFGFSPSIQYLLARESHDIIGRIHSELTQNRPCIMLTDNHAMVCDGRLHNYLHLNFGWSGAANGYYLFPISVGKDDYLQGVVVGIKPETQTPIEKVVRLDKAGTLASKLTAEEMRTVGKLTISGPLDGSDIILLRKMAGATYETDSISWIGVLTDLDLSKAKITKDKTIYLRRHPSESWTMTFRGGKKPEKITFDLSNMDDQKWKKFVLSGLSKDKGLFYSKEADGYWANYHTERDEIGHHMFAGCSNLRNVILPQTTVVIHDRAFYECEALLTVDVPKSVFEIGTQAFAYTPMLEAVYYRRKPDKLGHHILENSNPMGKGFVYIHNPKK